MTLVVSEVSAAFGCVLVGDSAITVTRPDRPIEIRFGASKIHYSADSNIGFAVWGNARFGSRQCDQLVKEFSDQLTGSDTPSTAGAKLASLLAEAGNADGRSWEKLRGGVHVAGYEDGNPVLYHVHTGHHGATPSQHALHKDNPCIAERAVLRNGYHPFYNTLIPGLENYAMNLKALGLSWPFKSLDDRVSFNELAVDIVAQTLTAAGRVQSVGGTKAAIAFTPAGLWLDRRLPVIDLELDQDATHDACY